MSPSAAKPRRKRPRSEAPASDPSFAAYRWLELPVYVTTADGLCLYANPALGTLLGREPDTLQGQPLDTLFTDPAAQRVLADDRFSLETGEPRHTELLLEIQGQRRLLQFRRSCRPLPSSLRASSRSGACLVVTVQDLTPLQQSREQVLRLEQALSCCGEYLALVDAHYRFVLANESLARALGRSLPDLAGRDVAEVLGRTSFERSLKLLLDQCLAGESLEVQTWLSFAALGRRYVHMVCTPWRDSAQERPTAILCLRDITHTLTLAAAEEEEPVCAPPERERLEGEAQPQGMYHLFLERRILERSTKLAQTNARLLDKINELESFRLELSDYRTRLRELAYELAMVEQRERRRLAMELHDGIGQDLAMARMRLSCLKDALGHLGLARDFENLLHLVKKMIDQSRGLVWEMGTPELYELGLEAALEELAEELQERHGLQITVVRGYPESLELGEDRKIMLYQMLRELLANCVKHAQAERVVVELCRDPWGLRCTVADNGRGLSAPLGTAARKRDSGFGLFSIRERLDLIGGALEICSSEQGTRCTIHLPHPPQVVDGAEPASTDRRTC